MKKQNRPPILAIVFIIILVCLLIFLRFFPDFSFSNYFPQEESETVSKVDSIPPVIYCDITNKTIKAGDTISISKLGVRVTDNSKVDSLLFTKIRSDNFYTGDSNSDDEKLQAMKKAYAEGIAFSGEEFQFAYGGIYELTITATDIYSNTSDFTFTLKVETPPVIETPTDYYVATGTEIPYDKFVKVWDLIDGEYDFSDITLDTSSLNISAEGNYPISFAATDNYGLCSTKNATVHIMSKTKIQELIDTQTINASEHAIVGAYNQYSIGRYADASLLETAIAPAIVQIGNDTNDIAGTGFIIKIDDDFITIAANSSTLADHLTVLVSFFDHSTYNASVVFTNEEYNLAFIRIPINGASESSSVSSDIVSTLRTVHLDEQQWDLHPATKKVSFEQMLRHYELVFKYKLQNK